MKLSIDLEDGSGVQVFKAEDAAGVIQKLTVAQANATAKIRELHERVQQQQRQIGAMLRLLDDLRKCKALLPYSVRSVLENVVDALDLGT